MMARMESPLFIVTLFVTLIAMLMCSPPEGDTHEGVSYDELVYLNASCDPMDTCRARGLDEDFPDWHTCMCGTACVHMGTCCVDSPFSNTTRSSATAECLRVDGENTFYLVGTCSPGWSDDGLVEGLCKGDGKDTGDPFLTIPVTSLKSGITYKNYFCSVCGEEQDEDLSFWNIKLSKKGGSMDNKTLPEMYYKDAIGSWMMSSGEYGLGVPVTITTAVPPGLRHLVQECKPDLVSTCSADWTDGELARKCGAYMAMVVYHREGSGMVWYKNPHCAICNHENVLESSCVEDFEFLRPGGLKNAFFVGLFVLEDSKEECSKEMVYDVFFKKCRIAKCPRSMVYRDRKCVLKKA